MPDDSNPNPYQPSSSATPASNQNLIIGIIMGAAILLLIFLVVSSSQNNTNNSTTGTSSEVAELKDRIANLNRERDFTTVSQNLGSGTNNYGVDPLKLAEEISTEANALAGLIGNFGSAIQQKDALLQTARDTESLLNRRIQDLEKKLGDLSTSAAEAVQLKRELESLRTLYDNAQRQIEELRKRPDAATLEELRRRNEDLSNRIAALNELPSENARLLAENRRLQALLDRSTLFVENTNALPANVQQLFRELGRLEDHSPAELEAQYLRFDRQLNARPLRSIDFATGSSNLGNDKIGIIKNDLTSTHPDAFFLIVGYASKTGKLEDNRKLSSDRATAVASQVNFDKRASQQVRAVFLSETSRFSKDQSPPNQICEIWEIRP